MQATSPAYKTVIAGAAMTVEHQVVWTLPVAAAAYDDVTLTVESITVDSQLTTDMPDGTRLITGYPATQANLTLSGLIDDTPGASKSIAWLLNPPQTDSPLFRTDVLSTPLVIKAGVYVGGSAAAEMVPIFTGTVDDYTVDMQAGTVTLIGLDYRTKFSKIPPLPLGAYSYGPAAAALVTGSYGPLLTSGWVLNLLLESIGLYTSPPARSNLKIRQTGHGGAWPETGYNSAIAIVSNDPSWVPGKFWAQVPTKSQSNYYNTPPSGVSRGTITGDIGSSGDDWFVEGWFRADAIPDTVFLQGEAYELHMYGTGSPTVSLRLGVALNGPMTDYNAYAYVTTEPGTVVSSIASTATITADGAWHYFALAFSFTDATHWNVRFYLDGTQENHTGIVHGASVQANYTPTVVTMTADAPVESVQVTTETGTPASNSTWVASSAVDVDASLNNLTTVPDVAGADAWSTIQQIAQAEGAVAGWDETGTFRFLNRTTLRSQTPVRTITPTYSLKTLQQQVGNSFVRNHITLPVNTLQVNDYGSIWAAASIIYVPGGRTFSTVITTQFPVVNLGVTTGVIPGGGLVVGSGYRASKGINGVGGAVTNLIMTVTQLTPTTIAVSVRNPNKIGVYLVSPTGAGYPAASDGKPAVNVGGQFVVPIGTPTDLTTTTSSDQAADSQWPPASEGGAVTNPRGESLLAIAANQWVQDADGAQVLTDELLGDLYKPRPLWRNVAVVPDPSLQLADLITITDPVTTLLSGTALIIGSHYQFTRTSWSQTLDLRATGWPGGWLMGVPGASEMGVTTYV